MRIIAPPFADGCHLSFPGEDFDRVLEGALSVLYGAGAHARYEGLLDLGDGGTVKYKREHKRVGWLGVSGASLASLRGTGTSFRDLCSVFACSPHRVTKLDVALDVPRDAPPVLRRLLQRARRGGVSLTEKPISRFQVRHVSRASLTGPGTTGTVYLGDRRRDVSALVYDKRNQLVDSAVTRHGRTPEVIALNDPGPLTRYELRMGRHSGCTLRDVMDPAAVFWHHMGRSVLRRPAGVERWQSHAVGYSLPPPPEPNYVLQLELLLERSPDVRRMVAIADKLGPNGRELLCRRLHRMKWKLPALVARTA